MTDSAMIKLKGDTTSNTHNTSTCILVTTTRTSVTTSRVNIVQTLKHLLVGVMCVCEG